MSAGSYVTHQQKTQREDLYKLEQSRIAKIEERIAFTCYWEQGGKFREKQTCKASRTASSGKQIGNVFNIFHDGKEDENQGEAGVIA